MGLQCVLWIFSTFGLQFYAVSIAYVSSFDLLVCFSFSFPFFSFLRGFSFCFSMKFSLILFHCALYTFVLAPFSKVYFTCEIHYYEQKQLKLLFIKNTHKICRNSGTHTSISFRISFLEYNHG